AKGNYSATLDKAYTNGEALSVTAKDAANNVSGAAKVFATASLSDSTANFELVPVFEKQTSHQDKTVVNASTRNSLYDTIDFVITGKDGYITLDLSNESRILNGSVSYQIIGSGLSSSSSQSISKVGSSHDTIILNKNLPLSEGAYTLILDAYFSGSNISLNITEKAPVTQDVFTGYESINGHIFADTANKPESYQIKVGDQTLVHSADQSAQSMTVNTPDGTLTINSDGSYQYKSLATSHSDASETSLSIQILDMNGKPLKTHTASLDKDTTPPEAGTLTLVDYEDTGSSDSDRISSDNSFGLHIQGHELGSTVTYESSLDNGDTWQVMDGNSVTNLEDGSYLLRAKVSDASSNISYTNSIAVTVDTQAPDLYNAIGTNYNLDTGLISLTTATEYDLSLYKTSDGARSEITDLSAVPFEAGTYEAVLTDIAGNSATQAINMVSPSTYYSAKDNDAMYIVKTTKDDSEIITGNNNDLLITDGDINWQAGEGNNTLIHTGSDRYSSISVDGGNGDDHFTLHSVYGSIYLQGNNGDDRFTLHPVGRAYLYGGDGDDIYDINPGDATSFEIDINEYSNWGYDKLYLRNITPDEVSLTSRRTDVYLNVTKIQQISHEMIDLEGNPYTETYENVHSGSIKISNQLSNHSIESIYFDDGTVWNQEYILSVIG
ncbi:Ig-like domain-containing protein, partial [Moraxella canis]